MPVVTLNAASSDMLDAAQYLVSQLDRVPLPLWAGFFAVLAAGIALFGAILSVWRTNAQHMKRLRVQLQAEADRQLQQLEHDESQRRIERVAAMRREAYFEALSECANANSLLFGVPTSKVRGDDSHLLDPALKALARAAVVGGPRIPALVGALSQQYRQAHIVAINVRLPVATLRNDEKHARRTADYLTEAYSKATAKALKITDLPAIEFGSPDNQRRLAACTAQQGDLSPKIDAAQKDRLAHRKRRNEVALEAVAKIAEAMTPARATLRELEAAFRDELGFGEDLSLIVSEGATGLRPEQEGNPGGIQPAAHG